MRRRLLAEGLSNPEIAEALAISRFTARNHAEQVLVKIGVSTRGRVAAALAALGAEVLVTDPYVERTALPAGARAVPLAELLARSTVVSLHARLTEETAGLIGEEQIRAMRPGSVLINCARGGLLDYTALAAALREGHLFAAGLDVYDVEPLPDDHPLDAELRAALVCLA